MLPNGWLYIKCADAIYFLFNDLLEDHYYLMEQYCTDLHKIFRLGII